MPRIRTIKPEFPQSESMGRVSRDARLTFIQLWTLADDSGRARGNSRMLASLLFPYDDDAPNHIEGWLQELERENCIVRYVVDGNHYLQILAWDEHQRIDKPSPSKYPSYEDSRKAREASQNVREDSAKARESSPLDQGSRTKDQGSGTKDQGGGEEKYTPPPKAEPIGFELEWQRWCDYLHAMDGKPNPIQLEQQLLKLHGLDPEKAKRDIEFSIDRGSKRILDSDNDWDKQRRDKGLGRKVPSIEEGILT